MIKSAVTISLVPEARGGPFIFWDDLEAGCRTALALGFDGVEVFPPDASAIEHSDLHHLLDENALHLAAVGTGAGWVKHKLTLTSGDPVVRQEAKEFVRSIVRVAGSLGAPAIIGSMQGRWGGDVTRELALDYLTEALRELADAAGSYGVPLLFEPLNRYETNVVNTIDDGVLLVQKVAADNLKLLADLFHMNIEERNLTLAIHAGTDHIGHVHFVDSNRRAAGWGHIYLRGIADALEQIGYNGFVSAEALPFPTPEEAAARTMQEFQSAFRSWKPTQFRGRGTKDA
jgi:sugar phosphate isomerase/epimerase